MRVLLADFVLVIHFGLAAFIVAGVALIWIGAWLEWRWVRNAWFRGGHILAIGVVALEAVLGVTCPLTLWEDSLRGGGGEASFVARWVQRMLYYDLPEWVFTIAYLAMAAVTALAWYLVPPRSVRNRTRALG